MTDLQARPYRNGLWGTFLAAQRLGLCALSAESSGLLSGQGAEIPQATGHGQKKKKVLSEAVGAEGRERCRSKDGKKKQGKAKMLIVCP